MPDQSYEQSFKSLTEKEVIILNLICTGLKHEEIAANIGIQLASVMARMASIYKKLGFEETISPVARRRLLESEVCPLLHEYLNNRLAPLEEPEKEKYHRNHTPTRVRASRPLNVFLCHSSTDKPMVRELYHHLDAEGWIDTWLDEEKLFPGEDWNYEIEKAVEKADVIVVFLTRTSVTKEGYVQREIRMVLDLAQYKPDGTVYIIPLRLEECEPPPRLKRWQYADYFPEDQRDRAYERLVTSLIKRAKSLGLLLEK